MRRLVANYSLQRISSARRGLRALFPVAFLMLVAASGCAHPHAAPRPPMPPPSSIPPPHREMQPIAPGQYAEQGVASWYGVPFNGRRTSNGEIYNMYEFTAAHRTLPFDSVVRITNLRNGKQTEVRINDRGPFVGDRVIDLSLGAARAIDLVGPGTTTVKIELLSGPNPLVGFFGVQVGAFSSPENAERLRVRLSQRFAPVAIQPYDSPNGTLYRVRVGRVSSEDAARQLAEQLRAEEQLAGLVVRLD